MSKQRWVSLMVASVFILCMGVQSMAQTTTSSLSERQKSIVVVAAFTASGDLDRLKPALNAGLDAGLTVNEIKEILVQMYAYAGFPRSLNGLNTFAGVLQERKAKGMADETGRGRSVPSAVWEGRRGQHGAMRCPAEEPQDHRGVHLAQQPDDPRYPMGQDLP